MRTRWISRTIVWARSGAFVPALVVLLTVCIATDIVVVPVLATLASGRSHVAANAEFLAGGPTLVAAMLSAFLAGALAAFGILRRGMDRLSQDKLLVLVRIEQLRAGRDLPDDQKFETIAILIRRGWCNPEQARALTNGAEDGVLAYLLEHLSRQSRLTQWAVRRLMEEGRPNRPAESRRPVSDRNVRTTRSIEGQSA